MDGARLAPSPYPRRVRPHPQRGDQRGDHAGERQHLELGQPEVDISYFFTKNIAVEAICCITPHKIRGTGAIAALGQIGKTTLFPPTVMLQYHFTEMGALQAVCRHRPQLHEVLRERTGPNYVGLNIRDSWGVAGQIGFDYMIDRHWGINFDVKKIYMEPRAAVTALTPGALPVSAKVKINPWIIGTGVTYRF
ncbi:MAG: OmpW family protein [Rhizobiales bacterium]|nr:OmpW family protein [Hyphomicrobiales bacterium]